MVKVQSRGLGKGLAALISEIPPAAEGGPIRDSGGTNEFASPGSLRTLPLSMIVPGKFQPRGRFSEESLRELAASIAQNGVMQPIVVRPLENTAQQMFEIVAGERRWRAAKMAGNPTIPAMVRMLSDQQALELALIENIQRADLTPLEEANGYQRLSDEFGYTQDELARTLGKSRSHISNVMRLLTLPEDVRILIDEGKLTGGHARALVGLPDEAACEVARAVAERQLSVRQVEALARRGGLPPMGEAEAETVAPKPRRARMADFSGPKDADLLALEETLSENIGMKVEIRTQREGGQGGELAIAYESLTQLDAILRRLGGAV